MGHEKTFDSIYTKSLMAVRANGLTRVGLSQYAHSDNIELPVPPKEEQASITTFLDRETAKIDALITEQQRLIELLQEKEAGGHLTCGDQGPEPERTDEGLGSGVAGRSAGALGSHGLGKNDIATRKLALLEAS